MAGQRRRSLRDIAVRLNAKILRNRLVIDGTALFENNYADRAKDAGDTNESRETGDTDASSHSDNSGSTGNTGRISNPSNASDTGSGRLLVLQRV